MRRLGFRADGRERRSPGVVIAVAGVAIAVSVMMITLSVVFGFKNQIRDKVTGFDSQITVTTIDEGSDSFFSVDNDFVASVRHVAGDRADISGSIVATGILKTDNDFAGLTFKSDTPGSFPAKFVASNIVEGVMPDYDAGSTDNEIIISRATSRMLRLSVGDRPMVYFVSDGNVKARRVTVAANYDTSFGERDRLIAFCSPSFLRGVGSLGDDMVGRVEINNLDFESLDEQTRHLRDELNRSYFTTGTGRYYICENVLTTGAVYFSWLELLDTNVVVIILLMSLVAAFTIVSCLFILILERVRMIGILKALGATDRFVARIFIYLAMRIVLLGMLIGNAAGFMLLWLQYRFHLVPLDPEAYYLAYVPVEVNVTDIDLLNLAVPLVACLVLIVPSMIITKISPSSTMRYE